MMPAGLPNSGLLHPIRPLWVCISRGCCLTWPWIGCQTGIHEIPSWQTTSEPKIPICAPGNGPPYLGSDFLTQSHAVVCQWPDRELHPGQSCWHECGRWKAAWSLQRPRGGKHSTGPWSSQRPPDTVQSTAPACFSCSHFLLKPAQTMDGWLRHNPLGTNRSSWQTPGRTWPLLWGTGHFLTASVLCSSIWTPSLDTTWPRYTISILKNSHFSGLSLSPVSLNLVKTAHRLSECSFGMAVKTIMSSR